MIGPAPIAQVADFDLEVLAKFRPTALRPILLNLMLDLPGIEQVKLEVGDAKHVAQFIVTVNSFQFIFKILACFVLI